MTRHPDRQQQTSASVGDVDRRLLTAAQRVHIADVPPELSRALRTAFAARESLMIRVRRTITAVMQFDGMAGPALAGVRGGSSAARQLVYASEVADVAFQATSQGEGVWRLDGIVLSIDDEVDDVQYDIRLASPVAGGEVVRATVTDAGGEFRFAAVGAGNYRMTVDGPHFAIEMEPFELVDTLE